MSCPPYQSIVCLLVTAGASLLVRDCEGRTARQLALTGGAEPGLTNYLQNQATPTPVDRQT